MNKNSMFTSPYCYLFLFSSFCSPLYGAHELAASAVYTTVQRLGSTLVTNMFSQPSITDRLGEMGSINVHNNASERNILSSLYRNFESKSPNVYWAKMGVLIELQPTDELESYAKEYAQFTAKIKSLYNNNEPLLNASDSVLGIYLQKLDNRHAYATLCREDALTAFNLFAQNANKETAKNAALFVRASKIFSQKSGSFLLPEALDALNRERKAIRPRLRTYLINFGSQDLMDLAGQKYDPVYLCDSDDEEDKKSPEARTVFNLMKVELTDSEDSEKEEEEEGKLAEQEDN